MQTTENNSPPQTTGDKLSELYQVTRTREYGPTGGLLRINYTFDFNFTSKEDYLNFRSLWKRNYASITEQTRACRAAHTAYRNAGGFGRRRNVTGDLDEATRVYRNTSEPCDREHRRMLCELRAASKKHAQACYLAAKATQETPVQK